ncbi:MAG: DEAD/DEAH box helicase [Bradyrhizobiaceae bacterium]|nr:DEAD/DEAH box helicase [Bradyrhizobiaceae bacterium]
MTFSQMNLDTQVLRAVQTAGYTEPTPIQAQAIPVVLAGSDVFGCAQTGTGKTAAFALPILTKLAQTKPRRGSATALILAPTRELASQIADSFRVYGKGLRVTTTVVYGGVSINRQHQEIRRGVDVIVATPGRLIDLLDQRMVSLDRVNTLVLDEADRMMDMGFLPQIKRILKVLPENRQTLFFSATVPQEIQKLAASMLTEPVHISVDPPSSAKVSIKQQRYRVARDQKRELLAHLLEIDGPESALVFTRTKHGADKVAKDLQRRGITADALHGNKSQAAREKALNGFKKGRTRVLVATDIAARGIDVRQLPYVVNFDVPENAETYVHRIGRTGRAGLEGTAVMLCSTDEESDVRAIERLIAESIEVVNEHPFALAQVELPKNPALQQGVGFKKGNASGHRSRGRGGFRRRA